MRDLFLGIAMVAALSAPAAAQTGGYGGGASQSVGSDDGASPLADLPDAAMSWMTNQMLRQAQAPGSLDELDADMEEAVGEDLAKFGARHKLSKDDVASAMRFMIVREAGRLLDQDIRERRRRAGRKPTDEDVLGIEGATMRRTRLKAMQEQAKRRMTHKAARIISE